MVAATQSKLKMPFRYWQQWWQTELLNHVTKFAKLKKLIRVLWLYYSQWNVSIIMQNINVQNCEQIYAYIYVKLIRSEQDHLTNNVHSPCFVLCGGWILQNLTHICQGCFTDTPILIWSTVSPTMMNISKKKTMNPHEMFNNTKLIKSHV